MNWHTFCSYAQLAKQRTYLGRRAQLRRDGGGATPARVSGRLKARARKQTTPMSSSPPSVAPGRLLIGGAATAAKNGALARVRVPAALRVDGGGG
jgi:hypothetical protein